MVNDSETTARNAEQTTTNDPGYCLQWSRQRAAIGSRYGDAATAWRNTNDPHPGDREPPRGSMVYWLGGSSGYGHIAPSLGGGNVRSTDAGGRGRVATVPLGWVESNWGLPYAGWAWDVNEITIPHDTSGGGSDDMPEYVSVKSTAAKGLKSGGWLDIPWDTINSDANGVVNAGSPGLLLSGRLYCGVLMFKVTGLPNGTTIRTRTYEGDFKGPNDTWQAVETNRQCEHVSTPGDTQGQDFRMGSVGNGRRLRFQITADADCTFESAELVLDYW